MQESKELKADKKTRDCNTMRIKVLGFQSYSVYLGIIYAIIGIG